MKESKTSNINDIVIEVVREIGKDQDSEVLMNADADTLLFGENLDSMGIVFLVANLESKIHETFDIQLTLADERAMSQKTSPFRSVKTLTKYIELLIREEKKPD